MAELTGTLSPGDIDTIYSRSAIALGTRIKDTSGNEYIFLRGVASCVKGSWVTYDEKQRTTLLAANAIGPVAVAQAAIVADKNGWFCIYGATQGCMAASSADNALVGFEITAGYAGDGKAAGDIIYNCIARTAEADAVATTQAEYQIWYPYVDDATASH